jgi:hypothetical protein
MTRIPKIEAKIKQTPRQHKMRTRPDHEDEKGYNRLFFVFAGFQLGQLGLELES